jgi:hypothetical protein
VPEFLRFVLFLEPRKSIGVADRVDVAWPAPGGATLLTFKPEFPFRCEPEGRSRMNSRIRTKLLPFAIASLLAASVPAMAQDTSSSLTGRVLDAPRQPVAGATVQIVHEPSGTT